MTAISKDKRIKKEIARLNKIFTDLDGSTKATLEGLIKRAAYMRVSLEDYEADLDDRGYVEQFTQSPSTPSYERERPVARLYNTMNKNYQSIMKTLVDSLPPPATPEISNEIMEYVRGAK